MQLDGHDIDASLSNDASPKLASRVARETFGIDEPIPPGGPLPKHRFKTLAVDGLTINNPEITIYRNESGCNGTPKMRDVPLRTEHDAEIQRCFGAPDLTLALAELKHLHVYVAFHERMLYASGADAH